MSCGVVGKGGYGAALGPDFVQVPEIHLFGLTSFSQEGICMHLYAFVIFDVGESECACDMESLRP